MALQQSIPHPSQRDCKHWWTYKAGRSVCCLCGAEEYDMRGIPRGQVAINGEAMSPFDVQEHFCCPICLTNLSSLVMEGKPALVCAAGHDIIKLGKAIPKKKRARMQARELDAADRRRVKELLE